MLDHVSPGRPSPQPLHRVLRARPLDSRLPGCTVASTMRARSVRNHRQVAAENVADRGVRAQPARPGLWLERDPPPARRGFRSNDPRCAGRTESASARARPEKSDGPVKHERQAPSAVGGGPGVMRRLLAGAQRLFQHLIGCGWRRPLALPPCSGLQVAVRLVRTRAHEQLLLGHDHTAWILEVLASELDELVYTEVVARGHVVPAGVRALAEQ